MFRIIQSLNNNAALVKNEHGEQAVVMGLGITFQKKKGDLIVKDKIENIFSLKNDEAKENFLTLLKDIPLDFISATYTVINHLVETYHYPVQEYLYVTLTDHIYCAYQAVLKNTYQESKLPNISAEYPLEYKMAREALAMFREKLLNDFPNDEIGRIALHLINAKGETVHPTSEEHDISKKIIAEVEQILIENGIKRTKANSNFYDRFMIHLSYFLNYLDRSHQSNESIASLEQYIKLQNPRAHQVGSQIFEMITSLVDEPVNDSERFYIVLHIQRLL
ncbi:TPA: PRD domain-containing protein [Streptococcus suis]|uniref:Transcriptional antiterminator n=1 Tax=Streptococcus suis TaxID=1307 RepID=A0AB33U238_STRSU|nr:PRD domain-containing protein [Streptococcus suis]MDW8767712.1 PRD domain-containing protein [Streptococcus suis]NQH85797.1 PRD domain-containing protein [Streptococcus suis]NQN16565.1 PRD domain-containing protein [Streptococcus suis]NQO65957.1 PRD domain-containing protein [Streptococcus suis]NQP00002.1 PRD domain-containing protein [Streptococcus suis]